MAEANRNPSSADAGPSEDVATSASPAMKEPKEGKKKKQYQQVHMPTREQIMQEDFMNNCAVRTGLSGVMGMGLGVAFGVFMGTMDSAGGGLDGNVAVANQTTKEAFLQMLRSTRARSWSYAKGFGAMGALFAGSECVVEKMRAKHDIYNSIYAGCAAGGALAHSAGPKGMCLGCVSFAAFSGFIDYIMER